MVDHSIVGRIKLAKVKNVLPNPNEIVVNQTTTSALINVENAISDDGSNVVLWDEVVTDEHDDIITDCDYSKDTDEHKENFATSIPANVVAVLETLNDLDEISTTLEAETVVT